MSEKRKDNHRRILRPGEGQRSDGRYSYTYQGIDGRRHTVYSWRLEKGDRVPAGKRDRGLSLREQEKQILRDLADGIDTNGGNQVLNDAIKAYLDSKIKLRQSTIFRYRYFADRFIKDSIGKKKLANIDGSTILAFYSNLYVNKGVSYSTIALVNQILHPVFVRAIKNGHLRLDPTAGILKEFKDRNNATAGKRFALTRQEQEMFFGYLDADNSGRYDLIRPLLVLLVETGLRIGECTALQRSDVDFDTNKLTINKTLSYQPDENYKSGYFISPPKTQKGHRTIKISPKARQAILEAKKAQMAAGIVSPTIDGYDSFIFVNSWSLPFSYINVNCWIKRITKDINAAEEVAAAKENRTPRLIRDFSCHTLRHTYATRAVENGVHPKALQEILGHEDFGTTMNIYSESQNDFVEQEIEKMWRVS